MLNGYASVFKLLKKVKSLQATNILVLYSANKTESYL